MPYSRESLPDDHTEFGGGPGMIDPEVRKDRGGMETHHLLWEIYATNPAPPDTAALESASAGALEPGTQTAEEALVVRAAQIELENDPTTTPVPRVQFAEEPE